MRLVLASTSPRRAELLTAAGVPFTVEPVAADETAQEGERPEPYVRRIALAKSPPAGPPPPNTVILTADTAVTIDGPRSASRETNVDAARMLTRLSSRTHRVLTAIVLSHAAGRMEDLPVTNVTFHPLGPETVSWYLASGEPYDKAGAYAIQGLASRFVARIEGSYSNVVGPPGCDGVPAAGGRTCGRHLGSRRRHTAVMPIDAARKRIPRLGVARNPYVTQNQEDWGLRSVVLVLALGGLFYTTLSEGTEYYKHVDEVMRAPDQWYGKRLQLHGFVEKGSILHKPDTLDYKFKIHSNGAVVPASDSGIVPDTFKSDAEVVVKGTLGPTGFAIEPNGVMAKCPSKYEPGKAAPRVASPGAGSIPNVAAAQPALRVRKTTCAGQAGTR